MVSFGTAVVSAIQHSTGNLPFVSLTGDPVGSGFIASLARPGGQITGVSMMQGEQGLTGKRLDLLKDRIANGHPYRDDVQPWLARPPHRALHRQRRWRAGEGSY